VPEGACGFVTDTAERQIGPVAADVREGALQTDSPRVLRAPQGAHQRDPFFVGRFGRIPPHRAGRKGAERQPACLGLLAQPG